LHPPPVQFPVSWFVYRFPIHSLEAFDSSRLWQTDYAFQQQCVEKRDYETLELYVLNLLMGIA
jgi:hypothetical protein